MTEQRRTTRRRERSQRQRHGDYLGCHTLPDNFTQFPNSLYGIPSGAIAVWLVVKSHAFGAEYFLSYEQIGREAGMSWSGARRWLAWLSERHLVTIERRGNPAENEGHVYSAAEPREKTSTHGQGDHSPLVRVTTPPGQGDQAPHGQGDQRSKKQSTKEPAQTTTGENQPPPRGDSSSTATATASEMIAALDGNPFVASLKAWLARGRALSEKQTTALRNIYAERES